MLDASALLAYLQNESGGDSVRRYLEGGGAFVSAINWAEVLSKLAEEGRDPKDVTKALAEVGVIGEALMVQPLDAAQALEIARLRPLNRAAGLSLADRACLALAASLDLPALTADRVWADLGLGVRVELIR